MEDLEKLLRNHGRENCPKRIKHEHALRRAMLKSDFFHPNALVRTMKRLDLRGGFSLEVVAISLFSGFFLAVFVGFSVSGISVLAVSEGHGEEREIFQEMYMRGDLEYSGQDNDGSRVYVLRNAKNGDEIEIRDKSAYTIEMVSAINDGR